MKHLLAIVLFSMGIIDCIHGQPGMYQESEIEYQTIFFEAQEAKYKGDTDKQIELLSKLIKRDKTNAAVYAELARTYMAISNLELAQKNAKKAHQLDPNKEWYLLTLAEIYESSEQRSAAIDCYNKLKLINPRNPTIYHKAAQLLLHEKRPEEAVANLEKLQVEQGVDEETSRRIFDIHKTTGDRKKAVSTLQNLIAAYPDNVRYMGNLASYFMEIGEPENAKDIYEQILMLDPNHSKANIALVKKSSSKSEGSSKLTALIPIMENKNLPLDDKIKELMPYLTTMKKGDASTEDLTLLSSKLVALYPEEAKAYSLLGDVMFYQGKFKESESNYRKAITLDDRKFSLWSQYLQNLWELEKLADMKNMSEEAIDLYPNKVSAFIYHAISLAKDKSEASSYLEEAQMVAGKNPMLSTQISITKNWISNEKLSKDELKKLNLKSISEPLFFELAADLYQRAGDSNMATQLYKQAIRLGAGETRINQKAGLE